MRELLLVRRLHLPHQQLEARGLLLCTAAAQLLQHRLTLHVGEARGRVGGQAASVPTKGVQKKGVGRLG